MSLWIFKKNLLLLGKQFLYLSMLAAVWVPNKVDTACVDRKSRLKLKFKQSIFWWGLRKVIYHWTTIYSIQYLYTAFTPPHQWIFISNFSVISALKYNNRLGPKLRSFWSICRKVVVVWPAQVRQMSQTSLSSPFLPL